MEKKIKVRAPATVANVGPGFDAMGFAVNEPGDIVIVTLTDEIGVRITRVTGDGGKLPTNPEKNTAGVSVLEYLKSLKMKQGVSIDVHKNMPLGSGMGSSAASAVASVFALNELLGNPKKDPGELLPFAMEGERVACGTAHADNVAPALLGGFVFVYSYDPLKYKQIPYPDNIFCTLVKPDIEILTADARKVLPREITKEAAVQHAGYFASLMGGLTLSDYDLIAHGLNDNIAEPYRSVLIPGYTQVKEAALEEGALGCNISGSGPTVFALSTSLQQAERVGEKMAMAFRNAGMESVTYISGINKQGPKIIGKFICNKPLDKLKMTEI